MTEMREILPPHDLLDILKIYDATGWSIEKIRGYLPGSSIEE